MAKLAEHYQLGIGVATGVLIAVYVVVSIFAIRKRRSVRGDISLMGMIPIVHIFLFFSGRKKNSANSIVNSDEPIEDMF